MTPSHFQHHPQPHNKTHATMAPVSNVLILTRVVVAKLATLPKRSVALKEKAVMLNLKTGDLGHLVCLM